jgi:HPt (histidine-containing phosphotransfer) domain-containing protein
MTLKSKLDFRYLETMAAGDPQTMKNLLEALLVELRDNLPRAGQLLQAKDWVGLERFCHHFKSTLSFSGHAALVKANENLWKIAKQQGKSSADAHALLTQMEQYANSVTQEVNRLLKNR